MLFRSVAAGFLAALMSSLSSVFNSCSTLVTIDIYKKLSPAATDRRLVFVGQITTVVLVVVGLAWIPLMDGVNPQLYVYLQSVQAYIAPPGPMFLSIEHFEQRRIGYESPKDIRVNGNELFVTTWQYVMEGTLSQGIGAFVLPTI